MSGKKQVFDPIVGFGKYKAQGLKLSEIPTDYVRYLTKPTDEGDNFYHDGIDWGEAAKAEIIRRAHGLPLPLRAALPTETLEEVKFAKGAHARAKTEAINISLEAVDDASLYLLRDFITRKDKTELLTKWLANYVQEAARYGKVMGVDVVNEWVELLLISYRGHLFSVRVAKAQLTLNGIDPSGD